MGGRRMPRAASAATDRLRCPPPAQHHQQRLERVVRPSRAIKAEVCSRCRRRQAAATSPAHQQASSAATDQRAAQPEEPPGAFERIQPLIKASPESGKHTLRASQKAIERRNSRGRLGILIHRTQLPQARRPLPGTASSPRPGHSAKVQRWAAACDADVGAFEQLPRCRPRPPRGHGKCGSRAAADRHRTRRWNRGSAGLGRSLASEAPI